MRVIRPGPSRIAPRISPRAPEFVGWIPCGGDLGDDTLDHRAGEDPGRCPLAPIGYSPRAVLRAAPIERAITEPSLHSYAVTRSTTPRRHVGPRAVDAKTA